MAEPRTRAAKAAPVEEQPESQDTPEPPRPVTGLHGKIALVLGEMERIAKGGWNDAQKYAFAKEGDIAAMIRASLAQHGIAYSVTMASEPRLTEIKSRSGTIGDRAHVHLRFTLTDSDNPDDAETCDWWGYADDYQDKAVGKAVTGVKKSWLVARFLVDTGDPEPDGTGEQRAAPGHAAPPAAVDRSQPASPGLVRKLFAVGREKGVEPDHVKLSARLSTRTREEPHGRSINALTIAEAEGLLVSLENWPDRPANWDERMGKLAAAMAEAADREREAAEAASAAAAQDAAEAGDLPPAAPVEPPTDADAEPEPEEHPPVCTCGAGDDAPMGEHAESCSLSIPF